MVEKYFEANKKMWDEFAKENFKVENEYYSVKEFLSGKSSLKAFELQEVGPVAGKSLLHLQCHFGLDTLSWVREGANAKGIDFSSQAIKLARIGVKIHSIRGGTDGAKLSSKGIPTPNIFSGGLLFHSRKEYIPTLALQKASEVLIHLANLWIKL